MTEHALRMAAMNCQLIELAKIENMTGAKHTMDGRCGAIPLSTKNKYDRGRGLQRTKPYPHQETARGGGEL
jgi:hypothetical protein